jgi:hypothetical protein
LRQVLNLTQVNSLIFIAFWNIIMMLKKLRFCLVFVGTECHKFLPYSKN